MCRMRAQLWQTCARATFLLLRLASRQIDTLRVQAVEIIVLNHKGQPMRLRVNQMMVHAIHDVHQQPMAGKQQQCATTAPLSYIAHVSSHHC